MPRGGGRRGGSRIRSGQWPICPTAFLSGELAVRYLT